MDTRPARLRALEAVKHAILSEREAVYGDPHLNFGRTAEVLNIVLEPGQRFSHLDVSAIMASVKVARLAQTPYHYDTWLDLAGYALIACALIDAQEAEQCRYEEEDA